MKFLQLVFFALVILLMSCHPEVGTNCIIHQGSSVIKVVINKRDGICKSLRSLRISGTTEIPVSEWKLNYPVYHFECADMDEDGTNDMLIGVIKATRFDPVKRKRIFIFKLVEGYIRPIWLGSRVSQPLEDFRIINQGAKNLLRTIEREENGNFLIAEYKWKGFGLTFIHYLQRNLNADSAWDLFNTPT